MVRTSAPAIVPTLHAGTLSPEERTVRRDYADHYWTLHHERYQRLFRGILYRRGAPTTDAAVADLAATVWQRMARGGPKAAALVERYDPDRNPASQVLEDKLAAFDAWFEGTVRHEAQLAADNQRRRVRRWRAREE